MPAFFVPFALREPSHLAAAHREHFAPRGPAVAALQILARCAPDVVPRVIVALYLYFQRPVETVETLQGKEPEPDKMYLHVQQWLPEVVAGEGSTI
jgi:hypothetical protein